jgi:hypothetical protein
MRSAVIGVVVVACFVIAAVAGGADRSQPLVPREVPSSAVGGGDLIAMTAPAGENRQQLTVIDPKLQVISVYHVNLTNGEIALKSVRNIHWDLQMAEFNPVSPSPREVRTIVEQR